VGWNRCLESGLEIESAAAFLLIQMLAVAGRDQLGLESAIVFPVAPTQLSQILTLQTSARSRLALIHGAERNLFFGPARTPEYSFIHPRWRPSDKDKPAVLMRRILHEGQHRSLDSAFARFSEIASVPHCFALFSSLYPLRLSAIC